MTAAEILRSEHVIDGTPGQGAALIEPLLRRLAGAGCALVSLALDYGAAAKPGEQVVAEAWVDRLTRTLVFAHGRLIGPGGAVVAVASAVLRRGAAEAAE